MLLQLIHCLDCFLQWSQEEKLDDWKEDQEHSDDGDRLANIQRHTLVLKGVLERDVDVVGHVRSADHQEYSDDQGWNRRRPF